MAASFTSPACDRSSLLNPTTATTTATIAAGRTIGPLSVRNTGCATTTAATTTARTVKIQAFEAECAAATTTTPGGTAHNQQTMLGSPGPFEDT